MKNIEAFDMTPSEFAPLVRTCIEAGQVAYVLGPPGLGKSTMGAALAADMARDFRDVRLAYYAPTDVSGMPYLDREGSEPEMKFAPMGLLPRSPGSMLMLDEFPLAARQTQNAALQLVLDKRVGDFHLPGDTAVVMAGNRAEDRCFSEKQSAAMINRVVVLRLKPSLDDWCEWAYANDIDLRIVAYVRFNPDSLLDFNPSTWNGESNFASPRSWEALHLLMNTPTYPTLSKDSKRKLHVGRIGPAVGAEFSGYLEVYEALPSLEHILMDPMKAPVPDEASAKIAAAAMVANHATKKNLDALLTYAGRMEKMFEVFTIKSIVARDKGMLATPNIIRWVTQNPDVFRS
jgi:hypothetical protein